MDAATLRGIRKEFIAKYTLNVAGVMEWDMGKSPVKLAMISDTGSRVRGTAKEFVHAGWAAGGPPDDEDAILVGYAHVSDGTAVDASKLLSFPDLFKGVKIYYALHGEIRVAADAVASSAPASSK